MYINCPKCHNKTLKGNFCTLCGEILPMNSSSQEITTSNPFEKLRLRWILLWFIASIPIAIIIFAILGGLYYILNLIESIQGLFRDSALLLITESIFRYGFLTIWTYYIFKKHFISLKILIGNLGQKHPWKIILFIFIATVFYSLGAHWTLSYPLAKIMPDQISSLLNEKIFFSYNDTATPVIGNIVMFLNLVVLAPIFEELFFRGILFTRLSTKWNQTSAIIISSIIFGCLHPTNIIGASVFGAILCIFYTKTNSLMVPIAIHGINNLMIVVVVLLVGETDTGINQLTNFENELFVALLFVVVSSPIVFGILTRWWPKQNDDLPYNTNEKYLENT